MKSKMGEFESLRHLTDRADSTPRVIIELLDSVQPEGRGQLLHALVEAAVQMAMRRQPVWIDTHLLSPAAAISRYPGGPFEHLDNRIEATLFDKLGLFAPDVPAFIPVISASASDDQLRGIALLQEHRPRPIVIRFQELQFSERRLDDHLRRIAGGARVDDNPVHAVIDLGHVETVHPRRLTLTLALARMLTDRLGPASTTLLAGSIPADRHGFVTAVRDRPEVLLWREVARGVSGAEINYGDYGVVHPNPPAPGPPGPRTINPYLYYTVPNSVIAMRRQLRKEDGKVAKGAAGEAFTDLADELVARPEFAGSGYSWGDRELLGCRRGGGRTANRVSRWVAIAMSHHLEHLAQRGPSEL
ncbi:beta family protein [Lentzea nigeriaca]|uniref:beta family protein n=1 Tax=Lentzea nigeriaca TaxID=1128665 RepID=UPI001958EF8B|nr:hypothetical protein [Lentzea nigeriaca]MBM7864532.1 hypothetical protein [Lentzea nigeriaca]